MVKDQYSIRGKSIAELLKDVKDGVLDYKNTPSLKTLVPTIDFFLKVTDKTPKEDVLKFLCSENRKGSYYTGSRRINLLGEYHNAVVYLTNTNKM